MSLARLLEQATPPLRIAGIPPGVISADDWDVTDEVLETWPVMAQLLIDMAADLKRLDAWDHMATAHDGRYWREDVIAPLLARFAVLDGQAKEHNMNAIERLKDVSKPRWLTQERFSSGLDIGQWRTRAEAAEAALADTRRALEDIEKATHAGVALNHIGWVARRALAAADGGLTAPPMDLGGVVDDAEVANKIDRRAATGGGQEQQP